jgi:hypothetical protein
MDTRPNRWLIGGSLSLHIPVLNALSLGGSTTAHGLSGLHQIQIPLRTHSQSRWPFNSREKYLTQGSGAPCHVSFRFFFRFFRIGLVELQIDLQLESAIRPKARGLHSIWNAILRITFFIWFFIKTTQVLLKTIERSTRWRLGTTWEDFKTTQWSAEYLLSSGWFKHSWGLLACGTWGLLRTTLQGRQDYSKTSSWTTKYSRACRTDIPWPTTQVGTGTDYSVGPWDYSTWAARHLMPWSTMPTED